MTRNIFGKRPFLFKRQQGFVMLSSFLVTSLSQVSVHRPSFYARRFKQFMGDKVFKRMPTPLRSGPSLRREKLKRALSKESDHHHHHQHLELGASNQDSGVVMDPAFRGNKVKVNVFFFWGGGGGCEPHYCCIQCSS